MLCYLYKGTLPIIEFINQNIDSFKMADFLVEVLKFRLKHTPQCHQRRQELLPQSMAPAYRYIISLNYEAKPDYNLVKLQMACSEEDEKLALSSQLVIKNNRMAKDILYDNKLQEAQKKQAEGVDANAKSKPSQENSKIQDQNDSFEFNADCNELISSDKPIYINYRKVDAEL